MNTRSISKLILSSAIALSCTLGAASAQEQSDHPLIGRMPGASVLSKDVKEFDETTIALSPYHAGKFANTQHLEGKITKIKYSNPQNRSTLEIIANYRQGLEHAGFQTLFACSALECGDAGTNDELPDVGRWCIKGLDCDEPMRVIVGKLKRPNGDVYAMVRTINNGYSTRGTFLTIVESKALETGLVKVSAEALASDIGREGHAAIYGIYFDTGKSTVKPESDAALKEIAKLLNANSSLKLHVVGHTDNVGELPFNMSLSKQRGEAVVATLVAKFHIAPTRLAAAGVGPLAPVAPNADEQGRAKNRRVELVAQ